MITNPFVREETIDMTFIPPPKNFTPPTPQIRDDRRDWFELTDEERLAVREWEFGLAPLEILPPKARTFVRRHRRLEP